MKIGVISDTHGHHDPCIATLFDGVEHILHAGDIGSSSIILGLETIAPVTAVLSRQEQDVKGTDKRGSVASALFPHTVLSYQNAAGGRYTPPRRGQAASGLAECGLSFGNLQCRAVDNLWFDDCAGRS